MSRDTSKMPGDRRLWLEDGCPRCGAEAGARCHERSSAGRARRPGLALHAARGWRQRLCPTCKAKPGEPCLTPRGRRAARPHAARLSAARAELHTPEDVWRALERAGAQSALVRFSGGGGRHATLEKVSLKAAGRELIPEADHSELAGALAAPIWGRYGSFRGQRPIRATLVWNVAKRSLVLAGTRAGERFEQTLEAAAARPIAPPRDVSRDRSPAVEVRATGRLCERCGGPIAPSARPEARYCGKRCRQAASRTRLRELSGRAGLKPPERCSWCHGPMPTGLRPEARYCGKRCRQATSRARLALARQRDPAARASAPAAPNQQLHLQPA